ncbi:hypothetical protein BD560DRAFT_428601 [Blakeslea trispora]|nr:hypothetical protein BD560DRAFT_428601 [Blakeslea trispora]
MPFQNPIVESIHDSCVQMERKIDNLETQMTFMSERINSLTNVVMEMSNTLKRIESTSNLQGSTSSADNFSHMPEIIENPQRAFSIAQSIDREKLRMKRNNYNWEEKSFKSLELDYRKSMIDNFQRTAIDLHYPVDRCKDQWLAETLLPICITTKTASEHEFPESDNSQSVSYEQMSIASQKPIMCTRLDYFFRNRPIEIESFRIVLKYRH